MQDPDGYRVDDLLIDTRLRRVTRQGVDLGIGGLSFDLLLVLARAAPDVVSIDTLMERIWPGVVVSPETVTQRVKLLRQAVGDDADTPRYVAVRRGRGYHMTATVVPIRRAATGPSADGSPASGSPEDDALDRPVPLGAADRTRRRSLTLVAVVLLVGAGSLWWALRPITGSPVQQSPRSRPGVAAQGSIAVMPFANMTGDPAKEYLGDGMAEELINALSAVPGLKVPARTSTFSYKGHATDIRRIAHELGVATILEGSVRGAGERIRFSAQLVDANTGFDIWSQTYDRQSADLLKLQDDLATQIVQALRTKLNLDLPSAGAPAVPTRDVEAYQLYLQAGSAVTGTPKSFRQSISLYTQALARDPTFAHALSARAVMHQALVSLGYPQPHELEDAESDARAALALDPNLAQAHQELGSTSALKGNWSQAETEFQAAIAADPADGIIRSKHAILVLTSAGRLRQALEEATEGHRLAPANGYTIEMLADVDTLLARDADAAKLAELGLNVGVAPARFATNYAMASARQVHYAEAAQRALEALPSVFSNARESEVVQLVYSALGDPAKNASARKALQGLLNELKASEDQAQLWNDSIAWFTMLGAVDQAYDLAGRWLNQNTSSGTVGVWIFLWTPEMRPFRLDPRFETLTARLGLMEYWEKYGPPDDCTLKGGKLTCH